MSKKGKPKKVKKPKPFTIMDAVDALMADVSADVSQLTPSQMIEVEKLVEAKRKKAKETP